jgi:hypothetical protein
MGTSLVLAVFLASSGGPPETDAKLDPATTCLDVGLATALGVALGTVVGAALAGGTALAAGFLFLCQGQCVDNPGMVFIVLSPYAALAGAIAGASAGYLGGLAVGASITALRQFDPPSSAPAPPPVFPDD